MKNKRTHFGIKNRHKSLQYITLDITVVVHTPVCVELHVLRDLK